MSDVTLNSNGVNSKIVAHTFSDEEMRRIGFTDRNPEDWYFHRDIGCEISFSVTIPKDGSDISIDVLDEGFLQPYDYQYFLSQDANHRAALLIKEKVEYWMKYLQDEGVLSGHEYGEYI